MTPLELFFDRIFVINLQRRVDRMEQVSAMLARFGITKWERFEAYDKPLDHEGRPSGNFGCTASHRALLEIIAYHRIPRALVLEDDCDILFEDFHDRFSKAVAELPSDWDQIFLGGHYAEAPIARVSKRIIRAGRILTTSSYGITWQHARMMAPYIQGVGPIDSLMSGFHRNARTYIVQPRLCVQRPSFSDLSERFCDNAQSMLDKAHEDSV